MTVIRLDPITGEPVIIAAKRSNRPTDFKSGENKKTDAFCPFCPGNEDNTPSPSYELVRGGNWLTRIFPNKFPIMTEMVEEYVNEDGLFIEISKKGVHDVVVEHPGHDMTFFKMDVKEMENLLITYKNRIKELKNNSTLTYVLLFKNYQSKAGASLEHPHSQIIGTPFIPTDIKRELQGFKVYRERTGGCVYCDLIKKEVDKEREIIRQSDFIVLTPYASRFPYETWILPVKHSCEFIDLTETELKNLAEIILKLFKRYRKVLGDFPYNMYLHTLPGDVSEFNDFHWHIEIAPRINSLGGFELGSGTYVNTVLPEYAANQLKKED